MSAELTEHMNQHVGIADAHYLAYPGPHGFVHRVRARDDRPITTLYTEGMGSRALPDAQEGEPTHVELVVRCPRGWFRDDKGGGVQITGSDDGDWLVELLQWLMHAPWRIGAAIYPGAVVPNGEPAEPYSSHTRFCGALIVPVLCVPEHAQDVIIDGVTTRLLSVVLLDAEELALADTRGLDALYQALDAIDVSDLVTPERPSAS